MMIPVGSEGDQEIALLTKDANGKVNYKSLLGVRYIPLTDKEKQCPHLYKREEHYKRKSDLWL